MRGRENYRRKFGRMRGRQMRCNERMEKMKGRKRKWTMRKKRIKIKSVETLL